LEGTAVKPQYLLAFFCIFALLALVLLFAAPANASATFTVNDLGDDSDASPGDGFCLTLGGKCTLRAAIEEANAFPGADTISITATGTIAVGSSLAISDVVTINGPGADTLAVSGGNLVRVFSTTVGIPVSMTSLAIANGFGQGAGINASGRLFLQSVKLYKNYTTQQGGAIYIQNGSLILIGTEMYSNTAQAGGGVFLYGLSDGNFTSSYWYSNTATSSGGAIYNNGGPVQINLSSIYSNSATFHGGGIANETGLVLQNSYLYSNTAGGLGGAIFSEAPVTISNSTLVTNSAASSGGAIYAGNGTMSMSNSTLSGNRSADGGAIFTFVTSTLSNNIFYSNTATSGGGAISGHALVTLTNSSLSLNHAGGNGGAIDNPSRLIASSDTFTNNSASSNGGAIYNSTQSTIQDSAFYTNTAANGGGIYNNVSALLSIANSTLHRNYAFGDGGGLYQAGTAFVTNTTFATNTGNTSGGAIFLQSNVQPSFTMTHGTLSGNVAGISGGAGIRSIVPGNGVLRNTLLANNAPGNNCSGTITSLGYNLEFGNTCVFTATGDLTSTNPLLLPLANNGGSTQTMALPSGSPAQNHIPYGTNGCGTYIATDQRGFARVPPCDIGAYEYALRLFLPLIMK
jgi:large repetitive protein